MQSEPGRAGNTLSGMELSPRYDGLPIISIEGSPDDQSAPVARQRRRLEAMLGALSDTEWKSPSRCDGWTVQDVIAHLVGVNGFWDVSVSAGIAGTPTRVLAGFDPAAHPPLMVEAMRAQTPQGVLEQFVKSNDGFLRALADLDEHGWSTIAESPAGHVPIRLLAHHALWDCWVHERDVALPLGLTPAAEPDEMQSCLHYAAAVSPALAISSGAEWDGVFAVEATDPELRFTVEVGESVIVRDCEAPRDAPRLRGRAVDLIEALSIRAPLPASTPTEWRQLLAGLAAAFDSELQL